MSRERPPFVQFDVNGLVPVIVQDSVMGDVLMLAYMNEDALRLTFETGRSHFWSRSRNSLWRKGETSGHEQIVDEVRINCEQNSVLLLVRQIGAVCHDGYPTCFYRRVTPNGSLKVVREQVFDPRDVYHEATPTTRTNETVEIDRLSEATRHQFGAYAYLRDHDLTAESSTSRRLRESNSDFRDRIADELHELAGVLDASHQHSDPKSDLVLESSQVLYWVILEALRSGVTWSRLRPDRALATAEDHIPMSMVAQLLRAEAARWSSNKDIAKDISAFAHATIALVGQACRSGGVVPVAPVEADLAELQSRPYLASLFSETANASAFNLQDIEHVEPRH